MKKLLLYIVTGVALTLLIFLLRPSKEVRRELSLADSLMQIKPDSSLVILRSLANDRNLSKEENALYCLLMTQALFKNRIPVKSDSLIRVATDYYDQSSDSVRKAWSYFYLGRILRNTESNDKVLECYLKALSAASGVNDYKLLSMINNYLAKLLQYVRPYEESFKYYKKALEYSILSNDTSGQIYCLSDLGINYTFIKEYDSAFYYYRKALALVDRCGDKSMLPTLYNRMGICFKEKKDYSQALKYVDLALGFAEDSIYKNHKYFLKSSVLISLGQYDSAKFYLEKGKVQNTFISKAGYHVQRARLDAQVGNYKDAYTNLKLYVVYADSVESKEKHDIVAELQQKYDYSQFRNVNNELRISRQRMHIILLIIGLVAIIMMSLFVYYLNRKKAIKIAMKEEIERMKEDLVNERLIFMQEQTIGVQNYQNELLKKEDEMEKRLFKKHEELELQFQKERELKEYILKMDAIVRKITSFNAMKPIQRSRSESEFTLSYKELADLEETVNLCCDDFAERLRDEFPRLKDDDVHLCCLLKLKVPGKNIMSLLDISEITLKKRKYRIKHDKMELPDYILTLDDYLIGF